METEAPLVDTRHQIRKILDRKAPRLLAYVLNLPRHSVAKALARSGRLIKCGLLKIRQHPANIAGLEFHSEELAIRLLRDAYDPRKLLKSFGVVTPAPPELGLADFPHLQMSLGLLLPYLKTV